MHGESDQGMHLRFAAQVAEMKIHGPDMDMQVPGDCRSFLTGQEHDGDLSFAFGECRLHGFRRFEDFAG